jgi:hypothetical protein
MKATIRPPEEIAPPLSVKVVPRGGFTDKRTVRAEAEYIAAMVDRLRADLLRRHVYPPGRL